MKYSPKCCAFARETGLPFGWVYLGYHIVRWHHALDEAHFARVLEQAAGRRGTLSRAQHIFWRGDLKGG